MLPIVFELPPVSLVEGGGGILMRLPVKYPELVIFFKEASRNFRSIFQDIEDAKNLKNIGTNTKSNYLSFKAFKKNQSSRDTVPLSTAVYSP
jgi:hypothetical protein